MGREFEAEKKKTIVTAGLFKHEIKINRNQAQILRFVFNPRIIMII